MLSFIHTNPAVSIDIPGNAHLMEEIKSFLPEGLVAYHRGDSISGTVEITPPAGKTISHKSINLTVFGEFRNEKKKPIERFFQRTQCLQPPGNLTATLKTDFTFPNLNLPTNTYYGTVVDAIFGIEVRVVHRVSDFVIEKEFVSLSYETYPLKTSLHNEIGMKNILHVEFVFPRQAYDAREAVIGTAYFILVKLRIVFIRMMIYRNEIFNSDSMYLKRKTVLKTYEILDGAPVRGDHIPIRIYMADSDIWPFHNFTGSHLEVEHYMRIEMTDENGKNYYKRMKIYFNRFKPSDIQAFVLPNQDDAH